MNEVQVLQIPHARRDLRRHVDETVETETTMKWHEFPFTKVKVFAVANPLDHRERRRVGDAEGKGDSYGCKSTKIEGAEVNQGCVAHD